MKSQIIGLRVASTCVRVDVTRAAGAPYHPRRSAGGRLSAAAVAKRAGFRGSGRSEPVAVEALPHAVAETATTPAAPC